MQLPNAWLWDMVDEFVYQFQSFQQYRGKLATKTPDEVALLRKNTKIWNVLAVLNYLQALVSASKIQDLLSAPGAGLPRSQALG